MGDPRRIRRKYSGPGHPWQKSRLDEERELLKEYGLKNKKELWKMVSTFKKFTNQAKKLIASITEQGEKEKDQLIGRLAKLGLLSSEARVEDVLSLNTKDFLERRLQTLVYRKGLAKTMKQARQFIVHEHIRVNSRKISSPCHLVTQGEEATIEFCNKSNLANIDHPERSSEKKEIVEEKPKKEKKEKRVKEKPKETKKKIEKKEKTKEEKPEEKKELKEEVTEEVKEE